MPAVAVTDNSNLFGLIKFYKEAERAGIKPIIGADLWLESLFIAEPASVSVLVRNEQGYKNLVLLISRAWQHNQQAGKALIKREWLAELSDGLIMLSAARHGELGQLLLADKQAEAQQLAQQFSQWFEQSFYLEVQRTSRPGDENCLHASVT